MLSDEGLNPHQIKQNYLARERMLDSIYGEMHLRDIPKSPHFKVISMGGILASPGKSLPYPVAIDTLDNIPRFAGERETAGFAYAIQFDDDPNGRQLPVYICRGNTWHPEHNRYFANPVDNLPQDGVLLRIFAHQNPREIDAGLRTGISRVHGHFSLHPSKDSPFGNIVYTHSSAANEAFVRYQNSNGEPNQGETRTFGNSRRLGALSYPVKAGIPINLRNGSEVDIVRDNKGNTLRITVFKPDPLKNPGLVLFIADQGIIQDTKQFLTTHDEFGSATPYDLT